MVDEVGNGARDHPGADDDADAVEHQQGGQGGADLVAHDVHDTIPGPAVQQAEQGGGSAQGDQHKFGGKARHHDAVDDGKGDGGQQYQGWNKTRLSLCRWHGMSSSW